MISFPNNKNQHETNDIHRSLFCSANLNFNGNIQNLVQHNNSNNNQTFFNNSTQYNPQLSHSIRIPQNLHKTDFSTTQNERNKYHHNNKFHHQNNILRRGDSITSTMTNQNEEFDNEAYFESTEISIYLNQNPKLKDEYIEESRNIVRRIIFQAVKEVGWDKNGIAIQDFKQLYTIIGDSMDSDEFKDYLYYIQYGCFLEHENMKIIVDHKNKFFNEFNINNKEIKSFVQGCFAQVKSDEIRKLQKKCYQVKKYKIKIKKSEAKMPNKSYKRGVKEHTYVVDYGNNKEVLKTFLGLGDTEKRDIKKMRITITKQEEEIHRLVSACFNHGIYKIKFVIHMIPFTRKKIYRI